MITIKKLPSKNSVYAQHLKDGQYKAPVQKFTQVTGSVQKTNTLSSKVVHEGITDYPVHDKGLLGQGRVRVAGSRTINLGNFESVRVEVQLELPVDKSDLEDTYEYVSDWVSTKISEAVAGAKG